MNKIEKISSIIEEKRNLFIEANDKIWDFAEIRFKEKKSADLLCDILGKEDFDVKKSVGGMETAFIASYGSGKPKIAILGEYDALFNMNQEAGIAKKKIVCAGKNGHGCGHNALGAGALAAVVGVKDYMKKNNIEGTICYYGCPAEEGGSGKTFMVKEGFFNDVDLALTWHPDSLNAITSTSSLADIEVYFKFYGKSAHAAACPHLGRSALDAIELMNIGVNYLREHVIPEARMHYAMTNGGGLSPNVVQANAEVLYLLRAPKFSQVKEIYDRVVNIAKGAALMTDTKFEIIFDCADSNLIPNDTLGKVMYKYLEKLGPVKVDENDIKFAEELRSTLSEEEKVSDLKDLSKELREKAKQSPVANFVKPFESSNETMPGTTDVADVSWVVPTAQCNTSTWMLGTPGHSWQAVAQGKSALCHKGLLLAGKVIALSAIEAFENKSLIDEAKTELKERLDGEEYISPIPDGAKPKIE
ncbi:amidohydrolase [Clostridium sp. DMHC 10]|uniref:M20 family metallopeptidase n=1 Tax=Clostridium sp. DMHC 10 TaxID=747377 RepID=UPI00069DB736|nr:M20 family metallopeptidase [Clostridium sp. DMHC 10]KOF55750.1 amidohydrolase [Clostridium sp. DMHC 10]